MPVKYSTTPERIHLGEVEPAKRMKARQACASSRHKFAYLKVDVCASTKGGPEPRLKVTSSRDIAGFVRDFLEPRVLLQEHFGTLLLDAQNQVIGFAVIAVGGLSSVALEQSAVFKPAILLPCASMILVHNHPSGNPMPSQADVNLTERAVKAGTLLGIRVLDHIIIGSGSEYFSFLDRGIMPSMGWEE